MPIFIVLNYQLKSPPPLLMYTQKIYLYRGSPAPWYGIWAREYLFVVAPVSHRWMKLYEAFLWCSL